MAWAYCGEFRGRPIGYAVEATCDYPGCKKRIDRGLSYLCGTMHGDEQFGCGGYFCGEHLFFGIHETNQNCAECLKFFEEAEQAPP